MPSLTNKRGRKPIFGRPMNGAERQRRYMERLAAQRPAHDWRVSEQVLLHAMIDPSELILRPASRVDDHERQR